jgi:glutamine synthetase
MDNKELLKRVKEDNVKFLSLQFTDVMGSVKVWTCRYVI